MRAAAIAPEVRRLVEAGDFEQATHYIFWVSDPLRNAEDDGDVETIRRLTAEEPVLTGLPIFDAAMAGLAERHCTAVGLPVPEWATKPERYVEPVGPGGMNLVWADVDPRMGEHGAILMEYSLETKRQWSRRLDLEGQGAPLTSEHEQTQEGEA